MHSDYPDPDDICPQVDGVTSAAGDLRFLKDDLDPLPPSPDDTAAPTKATIAERLKKRANELYALKRVGADSLPYTAPELIPQIESRSLLSVLEAVAEELERLRQELDSRRPG